MFVRVIPHDALTAVQLDNIIFDGVLLHSRQQPAGEYMRIKYMYGIYRSVLRILYQPVPYLFHNIIPA